MQLKNSSHLCYEKHGILRYLPTCIRNIIKFVEKLLKKIRRNECKLKKKKNVF